MKDSRYSGSPQVHFVRCVSYVSVILYSLFGLSGCGDSDNDLVAQRLSGTGSQQALPIQVDATPTPPPQPTPTAAPDVANAPLEANPTPNDLAELRTIDGMKRDALLPIGTTDLTALTPLPTPLTGMGGEETDSAAPPADSPNLLALQTPAQADEDPSASETVSDQANPADEADTAKAITPVASNGVTLKDLVVCTKVVKRNPSGSATKFSYGKVKKIYTWMKVSVKRPTQTVKHLYYRNDKLVYRETISLRYTAMRTWSQKTLKSGEALGQWKVVVTTKDEKEILAVKEFTVVK